MRIIKTWLEEEQPRSPRIGVTWKFTFDQGCVITQGNTTMSDAGGLPTAEGSDWVASRISKKIKRDGVSTNHDTHDVVQMLISVISLQYDLWILWTGLLKRTHPCCERAVP